MREITETKKSITKQRRTGDTKSRSTRAGAEVDHDDIGSSMIRGVKRTSRIFLLWRDMNSIIDRALLLQNEQLLEFIGGLHEGTEFLERAAAER